MKTFQKNSEGTWSRGRPIEIFKIDCEKCEWANWDWISADIRQILIESRGYHLSVATGGTMHQCRLPITMMRSPANNFAMFSKEVKRVRWWQPSSLATSSSTQTWGLTAKPFMLGRQQAASRTAALATSTLLATL
jgi:hypothetical protein